MIIPIYLQNDRPSKLRYIEWHSLSLINTGINIKRENVET